MASNKGLAKLVGDAARQEAREAEEARLARLDIPPGVITAVREAVRREIPGAVREALAANPALVELLELREGFRHCREELERLGHMLAHEQQSSGVNKELMSWLKRDKVETEKETARLQADLALARSALENANRPADGGTQPERGLNG